MLTAVIKKNSQIFMFKIPVLSNTSYLKTWMQKTLIYLFGSPVPMIFAPAILLQVPAGSQSQSLI